MALIKDKKMLSAKTKKIVLFLLACFFIPLVPLKSYDYKYQYFSDEKIRYVKGNYISDNCIKFQQVETTRLAFMNDVLGACGIMDEDTYKLETTDDREYFNTVGWNLLIFLAKRGFNTFQLIDTVTICDVKELKGKISFDKSLIYKYLSQEEKQMVTTKFNKLAHVLKRFN